MHWIKRRRETSAPRLKRVEVPAVPSFPGGQQHQNPIILVKAGRRSSSNNSNGAGSSNLSDSGSGCTVSHEGKYATVGRRSKHSLSGTGSTSTTAEQFHHHLSALQHQSNGKSGDKGRQNEFVGEPSLHLLLMPDDTSVQQQNGRTTGGGSALLTSSSETLLPAKVFCSSSSCGDRSSRLTRIDGEQLVAAPNHISTTAKASTDDDFVAFGTRNCQHQQQQFFSLTRNNNSSAKSASDAHQLLLPHCSLLSKEKSTHLLPLSTLQQRTSGQRRNLSPTFSSPAPPSPPISSIISEQQQQKVPIAPPPASTANNGMLGRRLLINSPPPPPFPSSQTFAQTPIPIPNNLSAVIPSSLSAQCHHQYSVVAAAPTALYSTTFYPSAAIEQQQMGVKYSKSHGGYIDDQKTDINAVSASINVMDVMEEIKYVTPQHYLPQASIDVKNNNDHDGRTKNAQNTLPNSIAKLHMNRNSTGSTSSQTSGFESSKSSVCQLANSGSSGSCNSNIVPNAAPSLCSGISGMYESPKSHASTSSDTASRSSILYGISGEPYDQFSSITTASEGSNRRSVLRCSRVNISEMMTKGIPDPEILAEWLQRLGLDGYLALFISQGYDLQTCSKITPEDLSALGVSNPDDRKRLINDIQNWNIANTWPSNVLPNTSTRQWLGDIGLRQYIDLFECQGYLTMSELERVEAEDLEDIGIKKLGHIKRIYCALKKLKQTRLPSTSGQSQSKDMSCRVSPSTSMAQTPVLSDQPQTSSPNQQPLMERRNSLPHSPNPRYSMPIFALVGGTLRTKKTPELLSTKEETAIQHEGIGTPCLNDLPRMSDKGPPKLNLYRTSQILSHVHVPKLSLVAHQSPSLQGANSYRPLAAPPPPAPIPNHSYGMQNTSISQPSTPNLQRLFATNVGTTFKPSFSNSAALQMNSVNMSEHFESLQLQDFCSNIESSIILSPPLPPTRTTPIL